MVDTVAPTSSREELLLRSLLTDSSLGSTVRKRAKEMFPDVAFPEDRIDPIAAELQSKLDATNAALEAVRAERAEEKKAAEEAAAKGRMDSALADAQRSYGLTTEGFEQMVKRMVDTGNYNDAEAAAAWVASKAPKPKAPGPTWAAEHLNLFGSRTDTGAEGLKFLHTDPLGFQDHQLSEFVRDPDAFVEGRAGY